MEARQLKANDKLLADIMQRIKCEDRFEVLDVLAAAAALTIRRCPDSGSGYNFLNDRLGVYLIKSDELSESDSD